MGLFKKEFTGTYRQHLNLMRMNYEKKPIQHRDLPQPDYFRYHAEDELNVVFRDKDKVYQNGKVYYAALVMANGQLFDTKTKKDCPATMIYSTHPIMEEYPQILKDVANEIYDYADKPLSQVPDSLKEVAARIKDDLSRDNVDFYISFKNPGNPRETIDSVDIHLSDVLVFRKDLPKGFLEGPLYPILAAPQVSTAILILPKKYWSTTCF